jgi:putative aldouronate transport system substrate-binding protein
LANVWRRTRGVTAGGAQGAFIDVSKPDGTWVGYNAIPPLKGPAGVRIAPYNPYFKVILGDLIITSACKQPDIAFRWGDGMYDRETTMRSVNGILGTDWRWAEPGEVGVDGKPAIWKDLGGSFGLTNHAWRQTGPSYRSFALFHGGAVEGEGPNGEVMLYDMSNKNYAPYEQPLDWSLPPLYYSTDQAQEVAEYAATINPYVSQAFAQFCTGENDVDGDWGSYLGTLEGMGLPQYLEIVQKTYDTGH